MSNNSAANVRKLVETYFSLQWCRENVVCPISIEPAPFPNEQIVTIAIGNITYLGTIGGKIKERLSDAGVQPRFVELADDKIQAILDEAANERFISGDGIEISEFTEEEVLAALQETSPDTQQEDFDFEWEIEEEEEEVEDDSLDLSTEMLGSKTQRAAGMILIKACKDDVSDIHIEAKEDSYKIRRRLDGVLEKYLTMPVKAGIQLMACLKNMAGMDIAERRASQDGKILRRFEGKRLEFRCSTIPVKNGEKMVLRILKSDSTILDLDTLISDQKVRDSFKKIIKLLNGIIIVSGPTGSGKSTTLAAALRAKDTGDLNIVTAEDPIEYDLGGDIVQSQVNRAKGQTFAMLLRTFLRQDPDVILIGETRDPETAESSMDAAETGHLVFTTLHANTSTSSLTRLLDMDVPKYKLNASVRAVLAQRLLRKVCICSVERPISEKDVQRTGIKPNTTIRYATVLSSEEKKKRAREKTICVRCNGTGYKGRIGAYELLIVNSKIQDAISHEKTDREIEQIAVQQGMLTLREYGVNLIKEKLTTVNELDRVCMSRNTEE